ncbi:MAG TPA: ribonuclease H-like domain-containing protein, partial [Terriglobia bacterium]|nr:ribonuclease H-like domain-containing protein [Terriglobia bacterium]
YPDEKATLAALAEALERYQGVVTFNGKTFDIPLLETRYALARLKSPFSRMVHLDLLHPARRLWKLRLLSCELTHLEREVLRIGREGDVAGSEIPGIYFDYLRTGNAQRLQPVFYHNALDVVTLAALALEMARTITDAGGERAIDSRDLFSLSRIFDRARATDKSVTTCKQALDAGLPEFIETRALWQLASQHKRSRQHEDAVETWKNLAGREPHVAVKALEELAIHYEHRERDVRTAMEFTMAAISRLRETPASALPLKRLNHRLERLRLKSVRAQTPGQLGPPLGRN